MGSMHMPSAVSSPPRCGREIPNGREQVSDICQGKEFVFVPFDWLKLAGNIRILGISTDCRET